MQRKKILESVVFIMDNATIHHALIFSEFVELHNLTVEYLSPYSYMLNPIEFSFSKSKVL